MKGTTRAKMDVNEKIHRWLGKCWHETAGSGADWWCCKEAADNNWTDRRMIEARSNYTTDPAACLKLIEAVREKTGWMVRIENWSYYGRLSWTAEFRNSDLVNKVVAARADTLTAAVAQAVSKLIDATADGNDGRKDE
jgi:hypothetical protein